MGRSRTKSQRRRRYVLVFFEDRSSRFFMRFADMINELLSRRWSSSRVWRGTIWYLSLTLLPLATNAAMAQPPATKARPSEAASQDARKSKAVAPADDSAPAPAPDIANAPVKDPSQTRKVAQIEVFKDPIVEQQQLLDVSKFRAIPPSPYTDADVLTVEDMAGNKLVPIDQPLIDRVVKGLAAKLTDRALIQALIETPEEEVKPVPVGPLDKVAKDALKKAEKKADAEAAARADAAKQIPTVTKHLLEPLFIARNAGHLAFLTAYERSLLQWLPPLLSNHLVPRVQAMIVLGESGSTEAVNVFEKTISDPKQTLWVKLWALEGIKKTKEYGEHLTSDAEAKAAKVISEFLDKPHPLPWPIQLRALEALAYLRQGFLPTAPSKAHMANTAMRFLADPEAKQEVRAEAAQSAGNDADHQRGTQVQLPPPRLRHGPARGRAGSPDQRPLLGHQTARGQSHQGRVSDRTPDWADLSGV